MRRLIPAALSIAAVSALALTAPSAGYAAPAAHGRAAKTITVTKADRAGDVVARAGTISDLKRNGSGLDPFRPGRGTAVSVTDVDRAMDLTKVTYRVRRSGAHPALTITYAVAGPFSHADTSSQVGSTYSMRQSVDGVAVVLAKGYTLQTMNDGLRGDNGLMNRRGKKVRCKGLRSTMKAGANVATQTVPLSCLAAAGVRSSRLRAVTMHGTVAATFTVSPPETSAVEPAVTIAVDKAEPTRRLQLTPLGK